MFVLDDPLRGYSSASWILGILISLALPFLTTYIVTSWQEYAAFKQTGSHRRPPTVPYALPGLGNVVSWVWNLENFLLDNVAKYGRSVPIGVNLAGMRWYIINGPVAISALLKQNRDMTGNAGILLAMKNAFGSPPKAVELYEGDDSGLYPSPYPHSKTKPEDRIFYIIHWMVNTFLSGQALSAISNHFTADLQTQLTALDLDTNWREIPDLNHFFRDRILESVVKALFGDHILRLNPTLVSDFWNYDKGVLKLFQRIPRWVDPGIYEAREKMVASIMKWHEFANEHYDCMAEKDDEGPDWDPYWGARIMRVRRREFGKMEKMDARARASDDLGFFWAANANAIPASCWLILETLSNSDLRSRVHGELEKSSKPGKTNTDHSLLDFDSFVHSPLMQSMYAETLRLRVCVMISRQPINDNFNFQGWTFRKTDWIGFVNTVESQNQEVWSSGPENSHPLNQFWADRFLVYPDDPLSGPARKTVSQKTRSDVKSVASTSNEPKFSMEGVANTWVPYGGAPRVCPGRHFAKHQMITTAAIWLKEFEIEVLKPESWRPSVDKKFIGFGTLPPESGIRGRIRRRVR